MFIQQHHRAKTRSRWFQQFLTGVAALMVLGISLALTPTHVQAQDNSSNTPAAGATISNTATATYEDNAGAPHTISSNTVITTVKQVASLTLTPDNNQTVRPGNQVAFSHTLTNTGNGDDTFDLAPQNGSGIFNSSTFEIYSQDDWDNGNTSNAITTTPSITSGGTFDFVIVTTVPYANDGAQGSVNVTATSTFDNNQTSSAADQATVKQAAITVTKSFSQSTADPGDQLTVTLTMKDNNSTDGSNLVINDPLPQGMSYVAGSGHWSESGAALTDASGGDPSGISYQANASNNTITATINSLTAGATQTLKFDVTIDDGTFGQTITNTATFNHDDIDQDQNTNDATVTINNYNVESGGDQPKEVTKNSANQGGTVDFLNKFQNTGTDTDTFNITLDTDNSTYPDGTTFKLFAANNNGEKGDELSDSNNDGKVDFGPVAAGDEFDIILEATLPNDATGGDFTIDKTATSIQDPNKTYTHTDKITSIAENTVDLTNDAAKGDNNAKGEGAGPESDAVVTNSTDPGTSTTFTLYVNNTGPQADAYDLTASTDQTFNNETLPDGWSVDFDVANDQTGSIDADGNKKVEVTVTIPNDEVPQTQSIYFRVKSDHSTAVDIIHDAVTVNTAGGLVMNKYQSTDCKLNSYTKNDIEADPGDIVCYKIEVTNESSAMVKNIEITDGAPAYTTIQEDSYLYGNSSYQNVDISDDGTDSGTLTVTSDKIYPGDSFTLYFAVEIDGSTPDSNSGSGDNGNTSVDQNWWHNKGYGDDSQSGDNHENHDNSHGYGWRHHQQGGD